MPRRVKPIPGLGEQATVACGPALPREHFDTIMVSIGEADGVIRLALLATDDYGNPRQVLAEVGINKGIYDYLKTAIDVIDRELLD